MTTNSPQNSNKNADVQDEHEPPSKTQLKQASERLKKLGLELVDLTPGERSKIPLDEELLAAVELCTRINRKKDGFRRQLQLIGKRLRAREVEPIEIALSNLRSSHTVANRHFHSLERLRDNIIKEGNDGINKVIEQYPQLERQKLRQMLRNAQKQEAENKPPAASREIFQYLRSEIPLP